ncbi:MAG: Lrp/AsnC family transcriptional regulator [Candidatus Micrarchaeota archaeon]
MDNLDYGILAHLLEDSRERMQAIARKLRVSEGTIRNRLQKMEGEKLITQYTLLLDPGKLGYKASAFIGLTVEPARFFSVLQAVSKIEEVRFACSCSGEYSIFIEVWKRDANAMAKFLDEKISKIQGVLKISPNIVVERVKFGKGPLKFD